MILIGLSGIFTDEYKPKMDGLILSTCMGKLQLITAKILASFIYSANASIIFSLPALICIVNSFGSLNGWNSPLQMIYGYRLSSFRLTSGQYLLTCILFNLLGCLERMKKIILCVDIIQLHNFIQEI
ncbi:MAG: hypothetical protein HPY74_05420 [Firmicutes bacterium]|nr:hypothetical protein [Bacillota bacterium]